MYLFLFQQQTLPCRLRYAVLLCYSQTPSITRRDVNKLNTINHK